MDLYVARLGEVNKAATRSEIDTGSVNGRSAFWSDVAADFAQDNPRFGTLIADAPEFKDIDPSRVAPHNGSKLCKIWGELVTQYHRSHANSKVSGEHSSNFFDFA